MEIVGEEEAVGSSPIDMSLKKSLLLKSRSSNWIGSVSACWDVRVLILRKFER
jgi:hypothetical protein